MFTVEACSQVRTLRANRAPPWPARAPPRHMHCFLSIHDKLLPHAGPGASGRPRGIPWASRGVPGGAPGTQ